MTAAITSITAPPARAALVIPADQRPDYDQLEELAARVADTITIVRRTRQAAHDAVNEYADARSALEVHLRLANPDDATIGQLLDLAGDL